MIFNCVTNVCACNKNTYIHLLVYLHRYSNVHTLLLARRYSCLIKFNWSHSSRSYVLHVSLFRIFLNIYLFNSFFFFFFFFALFHFHFKVNSSNLAAVCNNLLPPCFGSSFHFLCNARGHILCLSYNQFRLSQRIGPSLVRIPQCSVRFTHSCCSHSITVFSFILTAKSNGRFYCVLRCQANIIIIFYEILFLTRQSNILAICCKRIMK